MGGIRPQYGVGMEATGKGRPEVTGPPEAYLEEVGVPVKLFEHLVNSARGRSELTPAQRSELTTKLGLVEEESLPATPDLWPGPPPVEFTPEEEAAVVSPDYEANVEACLTGTMDWEDVFAPRVKASISLLRCRMKDLPVLYGDRARLKTLLLKFGHYHEYVFVLNMCLAHYVYGLDPKVGDFVGWWSDRGALRSNRTWNAYTKAVTVRLKSCVFADCYLGFVECTGLAGFRLLPDPTFDQVQATKDVSDGLGLEHTTSDGLAKAYGWTDCVDALFALPNPRKARDGAAEQTLTFEEFVTKSEGWTTSGASSFGRMYYSTGKGKVEKTKARKLMLPYISMPEILIALAKLATTSVNVAVIKSELAKIRIAVAGDLGFYLVWSYIHHLTGDVYDQWPGVTLAETPLQEYTRMWDMLRLVQSGLYGLPEDFASFDAQPLTSEVLAIGQALMQTAQTQRPELEPWIVFNCLNGLQHSTLSTTVGMNKHTYTVRNYLPSGIAITSAVGNAYNCVASESAIRLVEAWTAMQRGTWLKNLALRGDDTSFILTDSSFGYLLVIAGGLLNYKYAAGKIALVRGTTEMLRVNYSEYGARGYPSRVIPSLTQRKPWSNDPWDGEATLRTWWSTCATLQRRRCAGLRLWSRLLLVWSSYKKLDRRIPGTSNYAGGLGLGPPPARAIVITPGLHTTATLTGVSVRVGEWARSNTAKRFSNGGYLLTAGEVTHLAQQEAVSTLSTVDVREVANTAKDAYRESIVGLRITEKIFGLHGTHLDVMREVCERIARIETQDPWTNLPMICPPATFGRRWRDRKTLVLAREISQLRRVKVETLLESEFVADGRRVATRLHVGLSGGLDWLTGSGPSASFAWSHPQMASAISPVVAGLTEMAVGSGLVADGGLGGVFSEIGWMVGEAVCNNKIFNQVYSW